MHYLNIRSVYMNRKRIFIALISIACVLAAVVSFAIVRWVNYSQSASPVNASAQSGLLLGFTRVDRPAPGFRQPLLQGPGDVSVRQLAGRPVVINFWSSSCEICGEEAPAVAGVAHAMAGRVAFLGVDTVDFKSPAVAFAKHYGIPYQSISDPTGAVAGKYGVIGLPTTFFLSRNGTRILGVNVGALTGHKLTSILRTLYGIR